MEFKDYYQVLGVCRDAGADEIKRAYRKLARKYHPDVSKEADAEERFKEVGEAYEVLHDAEKRAAYDQLGTNWQDGQDFHPPPGWDQGFEFHGGGFSSADAERFSDFFETLFGHRADMGGAPGRAERPAFRNRGQDTFASILIELEDAFRGATRRLTLKHTELDAAGRPQIREHTLDVRIPKGVRMGQHIRLAGQGSPGAGGAGSGDLYLEIGFQPHPHYHVEGADVYLDLPVTPWEAALGARVQVPTPDGLVEMKVPPNSAPGRKMRLKGRGIPATTPGDLYVVLQIALPPADTEAQQAAYREFAQACDFNPRTRLGV